MSIYTFDTAAVLTVNANSAGGPDLDVTGHSDRHPAPNNLSIILNVTAASGTTPSLTVEVQWSNDGTTFFSASTPDAFTAITAVGTALKPFQVKGRFARLKYTVTGTTPSFTLTATGYAA